jgi:trimeric autotransporter adhesin
MRTALRRRLGLVGMTGLLALSGPLARAQTASLVADLAPGESGNAATNPYSLFAAGNHVFFAGSPTPYPLDLFQQLWVTDGTAAGTQRLPDRCGGQCFFSPHFYAAAGNAAFFGLSGSSNGGGTTQELWRSDGTPAGTFAISPSIGGGERSVAVLGGVVYMILFGGDLNDLTEQLWRFDGTASGTSAVANLGPPDSLASGRLFAAGGKLYLPGPDRAAMATDLWVSDGTPGGTTRVTAFDQTHLGPFAVAGDRFYFVVRGNTAGGQLWVSDGTMAGTRLATPQGVETVTWIKPAGARLYFEAALQAADPAQGGQLWVTDGTTAGTKPLTDSPGFLLGYSADQVEVVGGTLEFLGRQGQGAMGLWKVSPAGAIVSLCPSGCGSIGPDTILLRSGKNVLFASGDSDHGVALWGSDGTVAGTLRLHEICAAPCDQGPPDLTLLDTAVFFKLPGAGGLHDELWRSDGTAAGTRRFADPALDPQPPVPSPQSLLANLPGLVFFNAADDSGPQLHDELWVSDGTAAGTRQLTDASSALSSSPASLIAAGGRVFFQATSPASGATSLWSSAGTATTTQEALPAAPGAGLPVAAFGGVVFVQGSQLWQWDGTSGGARPLTSLLPPAAVSSQPVAAGGRVYFAVAGSGAAVWSSDGTPQGSAILFAMPPEARKILSVAVLGAAFYLIVDNPPGGMDVWKSDGTTAGTVRLAQFGSPGLPASGDPGFVGLGSRVYFIGLDGPDNTLWQTDGTPGGTSAIDASGGNALSNVSNLRAFGDALYFFGFLGDWGLFRSDGTAQGTMEVQSLSGFPAPDGLTPLGGGLAFAATDSARIYGQELWFTDGTAAGTRMVKDILPGSGNSQPRGLTEVAGRLYFTADDGVHGAELWTSDGTGAGTHMVQDINPGAASSTPSGMTAAGGLLFFSADDGLTGRELWALPLGGAGGCLPSATALCLSGGRYRVEAFWRDFQGNSGAGMAAPLTGDTGTFWFFSPDNLEVIVKVLDGRALNGHFWVFYGALSSVEYAVTVTDTATGLARRYFNPLGQLASVGDTTAFGPMGASSAGDPRASRAAASRGGHLPGAEERCDLDAPAILSGRAEGTAADLPGAGPPRRFADMEMRAVPAQAAGCHASPLQLCLQGGRFSVTVAWTDFGGHSGSGTAVQLTADTGSFWFFDAGNIEIVVKVLDGRGLNGHFWVFYGALSNVQYTLTVTDTLTGAVRTYNNPAGRFASVADTEAF